MDWDSLKVGNRTIESMLRTLARTLTLPSLKTCLTALLDSRRAFDEYRSLFCG